MPEAPKVFRPRAHQTKRERERTYNKARVRVDPDYAKYQSRRWRELRAQHLAMFPYCEFCHRLFGHRVPARIVNHRDPEQRARDFFDPDNLESCCRRCHGIISGCEKSGAVPWANATDRNGRVIRHGHKFYDERAEIYGRSAKLFGDG